MGGGCCGSPFAAHRVLAGVPKDKEEARRWLEEAASNGNKQARAMLDTNYQGEGLGSNKPDEGHKIMDNPKEL